jgi:hypothetical protein
MSVPTISLEYLPAPERCRCGALMPPHRLVIRVTSLPESQQNLFRDTVFCSANCLRAFCLETLETLATLDTPASKALVHDLHELHRELAQSLATILGSSLASSGGDR